jgi:hypothetical protein
LWPIARRIDQALDTGLVHDLFAKTKGFYSIYGLAYVQVAKHGMVYLYGIIGPHRAHYHAEHDSAKHGMVYLRQPN